MGGGENERTVVNEKRRQIHKKLDFSFSPPYVKIKNKKKKNLEYCYVVLSTKNLTRIEFLFLVPILRLLL